MNETSKEDCKVQKTLNNLLQGHLDY